VGSQELSAHVVKAAIAPPDTWVEQSPFNGVWCIYERPKKPRLWDVKGALRGMSVTESLDAALALAERVLPSSPEPADVPWNQWCIELTMSPVWRREVRLTWDCCLSNGLGFGGATVKAVATGPLALCIAILKATTASSVGTTEGREP